MPSLKWYLLLAAASQTESESESFKSEAEEHLVKHEVTRAEIELTLKRKREISRRECKKYFCFYQSRI